MTNVAADLSRRLSRRALDVCRRYLSNGQREGAYWTVGDVANTPGRSLYVRLTGPEGGPGAAGHWTDAATGDHGDLLDLIREACGLTAFADVLDESRRFLGAPPRPGRAHNGSGRDPPTSSPEPARRLFQSGRAVRGTLAETYLAHRGIVGRAPPCLRFHPGAFYRPGRDARRGAGPALLAGVTDLGGRIVGVQRTWLDPAGTGKAQILQPRRALGQLLGHGVRVGRAQDVLAAGEGLETMLSLVMALPRLPVVAALSANHLAALTLPPSVRRLYIAADNDAAGRRAAWRLRQRAEAAGAEVCDLAPRDGDFNDDLVALGCSGLMTHLRPQLIGADATHFAGRGAADQSARSRERTAS